MRYQAPPKRDADRFEVHGAQIDLNDPPFHLGPIGWTGIAIASIIGIIVWLSPAPGPATLHTPTPLPVIQPPADNRALHASVGFLSLIKGRLRDPGSVEWDVVLANTEGTVVCTQYRARNGFGGMTGGQAIYANQMLYTSALAWAEHCSGVLNDMRKARHALK